MVFGGGPPSRILTGAICGGILVGTTALTVWMGFCAPVENKFQKANVMVNAVAVMMTLISSRFLEFGLLCIVCVDDIPNLLARRFHVRHRNGAKEQTLEQNLEKTLKTSTPGQHYSAPQQQVESELQRGSDHRD